MVGHDEWLTRVQKIRTWRKGTERAPHKPLLLLWVISRLRATGSSQVAFAEAAPVVESLLREFGPPRDSFHPELPFYHLKSDAGLWVLKTDGSKPIPKQPSRSDLLQLHAIGGLAPEFEGALAQDSALATAIVQSLLSENFPETVQVDLCEEIGLDLDALAAGKAYAKKIRDPLFRKEVLEAYEARCGFCGYEGRIGSEAVGLDAAHIRWHAGAGPDQVENAVCLCSFHHKLFDRGVLSIGDEQNVLVSTKFVGHSEASERLVLGLVGNGILGPQPGFPKPAPSHVAWHQTEVFRGPARVPAQ